MSEPINIAALRAVMKAAKLTMPLGQPEARHGDDYQFGRYTDWRVPGLGVDFQSKELAALIVAAVNALPVLLDELEEARKEASDDTAELDEWFGRADKAEAEVERLGADHIEHTKTKVALAAARAEVARLTALVQGVREITEEAPPIPLATRNYEDGYRVGYKTAQSRITDLFAGGTDTPKDDEPHTSTDCQTPGCGHRNMVHHNDGRSDAAWTKCIYCSCTRYTAAQSDTGGTNE